MADSNITKKALANALKDLMKEMSFSKITIATICDKCDMNRKSFYYHFKDKYDLVNWIFYTEIIDVVKDKTYADNFDFFRDILYYFEDYREFYRRVFKYDGQNSFYDYFKELITPLANTNMSEMVGDIQKKDFVVSFLTDSVVGFIKRWLIEEEKMDADEFLSLIKTCIVGLANKYTDKEV